LLKDSYPSTAAVFLSPNKIFRVGLPIFLVKKITSNFKLIGKVLLGDVFDEKFTQHFQDKKRVVCRPAECEVVVLTVIGPHPDGLFNEKRYESVEVAAAGIVGQQLSAYSLHTLV
jgi:hypothetical protein